jgi:hypothetical protein
MPHFFGKIHTSIVACTKIRVKMKSILELKTWAKEFFLALQFEQEQEQEFKQDLFDRTIPVIRLYLIWGIILMSSFGWLDYYIFPESFTSLWFFRIIADIYLIVIIILSYAPFFKHLYEKMIASALIVGTVNLFAMLLIPNDLDSRSYYYAGLLLAISFSSILLLNVRIVLGVALSIILTYFFIETYCFGMLNEGLTSNKGILLINNIFFLVALSIISLLTTISLNYYHRKYFLFRKQILKEKHKSENLINKVFPTTVAKQIKEKGLFPPLKQEKLGILCFKINGLNDLLEDRGALSGFELINGIFAKLDQLTQQYQLEKIKTCQNLYILLEGLHTPASPQKLLTISDFVLKAQRVLIEYNRQNNLQLNIQGCIHHGNVFAGLVGDKGLTFEILGKDLERCQLLTHQATPDTIIVSKTVKMHIDNFYTFSFFETVTILNQKMETFILKG